MSKKFLSVISLLCILSLLLLSGCDNTVSSGELLKNYEQNTNAPLTSDAVTLDDIPEYSGSPYVALYDNQPLFSKDEITTVAFEKYADLDYLNRCGEAFACVGIEIMPTEDRESIGQVKPSGWVTAKYDFVDGKYLYNRCHLIGFQLTGENANERNLITGTRYMNTEGMLPFENMIADYVKETENHIMYRVTPIFEGDNLVANGVQMEAYSVEDNGEGVCFNVYCYNVQPGVIINYKTGESELDKESVPQTEETPSSSQYVLNTSSKKIHKPNCSGVKGIKEENKKTINNSQLQSYLDKGYGYCGNCF